MNNILEWLLYAMVAGLWLVGWILHRRLIGPDLRSRYKANNLLFAFLELSALPSSLAISLGSDGPNANIVVVTLILQSTIWGFGYLVSQLGVYALIWLDRRAPHR